jgi:hypothetical protein
MKNLSDKQLKKEITKAANAYIAAESKLGIAEEYYRNVISEAKRRGIEPPRTRLTNPWHKR